MVLWLTDQFVASPLNSSSHFDLGNCSHWWIEGLKNKNEIFLNYVPNSANIFPCDPEQTTTDVINILE